MTWRDDGRGRGDVCAAKRQRTALLAVTSVVGLLALPLRLAAAADWVELGPDGGDVRALAVAPSDALTAYAGTGGNGVFRSRDGGATWAAARTGMGRAVVQALAVHPRDGQCVFAGTADGHVFASYDGGASWRDASGSNGAAIPLG